MFHGILCGDLISAVEEGVSPVTISPGPWVHSLVLGVVVHLEVLARLACQPQLEFSRHKR